MNSFLTFVCFILSIVCIVLGMLLHDAIKKKKEAIQHALNEKNRHQNEMELEEKRHSQELLQKANECNEQIEELTAENNAKLQKLINEHQQSLANERQKIFKEKEELLSLSEKELIMETLFMLRNTFLTRADKFENSVASIANQTESVNGRLAIIDSELSKLLNREIPHSQENCAFTLPLTQDVFQSIVASVIRRPEFRRISNYSIDGASIRGVVNSIHRNSTWTFNINFNQQGKINGNYYYSADNDNSALPKNLAETIRKEIVFILHNAK